MGQDTESDGCTETFRGVFTVCCLVILLFLRRRGMPHSSQGCRVTGNQVPCWVGRVDPALVLVLGRIRVVSVFCPALSCSAQFV